MRMKPKKEDLVATYSIVGYDPQNQEWGIAVQSKFLAVGAYVPYAQAGVGAIATQSWCNSSFGPLGLAMLAEGMPPEKVLEELLQDDEGRESRQVGIIDAKGNAATFTGKDCYDWAGGEVGTHCTCQGNILVNPETVLNMKTTFENTQGPLADRLLLALDAAQSAGGDSRGKQSAAILVVKEKGGYGGYNDRMLDLRVDDHPEPIKELMRLHQLHKLYFGQSKPGNTVKIEGDLVVELKRMLSALERYNGEYTPSLDDSFLVSLKRYHLTENFDDRVDQEGYLDLEVLDFMRQQVQMLQK